MKQIVTVIGFVIFILSVSSCGGSKKQATKDVEIELNRCIKRALEKPALRSYGVGVHFREATAKNVAEAQASGEFRRKIERIIKTATRDEASGKELFAADNTTGQSVYDQSGGVNDFVTSIADGVVSNVAIVDMIMYKQPNNQYKIYVCMEYQNGDIPEMAAEITKKLEQKIPNKEKERMQREFDDFRKQIEEELKNYKEEE
jgi:hypothetical protein